jgi:hypothetical protein
MTPSAVVCAADIAWSRADRIALWTLIAGVFGIWIAWRTLRRGNRNSSVASMIPLNAEIRDMYDQYIEIFSSAQFQTPLELEILEREIADRLEKLMNVLEMSAAIQVERTFSGVSRTLMSEYLKRVLEDLLADDYTSNKVSGLLQDDRTYLYIRHFLDRTARLSVVLPTKWYVVPNRTIWQRIKDRLPSNLK